uniref:Unannotated protein n=1 Tax=freshwater metagenome TaxID=449393 RepID=A0A6J5ZCT4_9ZZZZ
MAYIQNRTAEGSATHQHLIRRHQKRRGFDVNDLLRPVGREKGEVSSK